MTQRVAEITKTLRAIHDGWPFFLAELQSRIESHTRQLISANNEETRGRIKALRDLTEWPSQLTRERDDLIAALSDEDAAT